MAETRLIITKSLEDKADNFILSWHDFSFDFWWRKKYNVAFGSPQHRSMSFIDMYLEFREEVLLNEMQKKLTQAEEEKENNALGIHASDGVSMTKEEIDKDYEDLDLSQFDKKN